MFEDSVTTEPPAGAETGMTTVLVVVVDPPTVVDGLRLRVMRVGVLTVRTAVAVPPPVAVIVEFMSCA